MTVYAYLRVSTEEQDYENQASGIAPTDGCDFSITVDGMKNMGL